MSLSGAIRPVAQAAARLKEAQKLGFARAVVPEAARGDSSDPNPGSNAGLALTSVGALISLVSEIAARGEKPRKIERNPEA